MDQAAIDLQIMYGAMMIDKLIPYLSAIKAAALVALAVALFGAGWHVNGWRKDAQIEKNNAARASDRATQAEGALADLSAASAKINTAATGYAASARTLGVSLDTMNKEFKNERAKNPLPADCRPTDERMRQFAAAVDAANKAATGQ